MIKCVLFDLDGTLFDDERLTVRSKVEAARKLGFDLTAEEIIATFGYSSENSAKLFEAKFGPGFKYDKISNTQCGYVLNYIKKHGFPYKPFARDVVIDLRARGYIVGICTSSTRKTIDSYRQYGDLFDKVDFSICGDEVVEGKPNPEVFLKGLQKAGVTPCEAVAVEDSNHGVRAAVKANIHVVMVPDLAKPDPDLLANPLVAIKPDLPSAERFVLEYV